MARATGSCGWTRFLVQARVFCSIHPLLPRLRRGFLPEAISLAGTSASVASALGRLLAVFHPRRERRSELGGRRRVLKPGWADPQIVSWTHANFRRDRTSSSIHPSAQSLEPTGQWCIQQPTPAPWNFPTDSPRGTASAVAAHGPLSKRDRQRRRAAGADALKHAGFADPQRCCSLHDSDILGIDGVRSPR